MSAIRKAIHEDLNANPFVEFGAAYVSSEWEGHRLQLLLTRARIAATVISYWTDIEITPMSAVEAVDTPAKKASRKTLFNAGFDPWANPAPIALVPCTIPIPCKELLAARAQGRACCSDYFQLPLIKAQASVDAFLRSTENGPVITLPHTKQPDTELLVDLSGLKAISDPDYRELLKDFVGRKGPT